MKFAGHTMGTPDLDVFGAIALFARIGFDGIEIRVAPDGQINPAAYTPDLGRRIRSALADAGIAIVCLTPYYRDFVAPAKRESELAGMRRVVEIAQDLGCPLVRSYGGILRPDVDPAVLRERAVSGLREAADYAAPRGIRIAVETHGGSLTVGARQTVAFVEEVDRGNVGILFDWAWVASAGQESPREAVDLVAPHLLHCHMKDWIVTQHTPFAYDAALMGRGELEWRETFGALVEIGYGGYVSDEYEKYWKRHLPDAEAGMKHDLEYATTVIASVGRQP